MVKKINLVGRRSLSSFIYKFLLVILLLLGLGYFVMFFGIIGGMTSNITSYYRLGSVYGIDIRLIELNAAYKEVLTLYSKKIIIFGAPSVVASGILIYNLAMVFQNFSLNMIFTMENFKKIRLIGILLIVSVVLGNIGVYFAAEELVKIKIAGIQFEPMFNLFDINYLYGLMIIVVSEVFRRAIILKEEQELTV